MKNLLHIFGYGLTMQHAYTSEILATLLNVLLLSCLFDNITILKHIQTTEIKYLVIEIPQVNDIFIYINKDNISKIIMLCKMERNEGFSIQCIWIQLLVQTYDALFYDTSYNGWFI